MLNPLFARLLALGIVACIACSGHDNTELDRKTSVVSGGQVVSGATTRTLAAGVTIRATIQDSISSRGNTTGKHVNAVVSLNVTDDSGHVVIPGGAAIVLSIARLGPAKGLSVADGVIELDVVSMTAGAATYKASGNVGPVPHTLQARAAAPAERDVIVTPGTPITITLTQPLRITTK